jgi:competence protein ComGC
VCLGFTIFIALPKIQQSKKRVEEAACIRDRFVIREATDQFTQDRNQPPESIRDLVKAHYIPEGFPRKFCMAENLDFDDSPVLGDPVLAPNQISFRATKK